MVVLTLDDDMGWFLPTAISRADLTQARVDGFAEVGDERVDRMVLVGSRSLVVGREP